MHVDDLAEGLAEFVYSHKDASALNEAVTERHRKALIRGWRRPLRYFGCGVAP